MEFETEILDDLDDLFVDFDSDPEELFIGSSGSDAFQLVVGSDAFSPSELLESSAFTAEVATADYSDELHSIYNGIQIIIVILAVILIRNMFTSIKGRFF